MEIVNYFTSLVTMVPLVILVTDFIIRWFKVENNSLRQALSWIVSVVLSLIGYFANLGMFAELSVIWTVVYGIAAGLVSNGVFDMNIVQMFLDFILKFLPEKE